MQLSSSFNISIITPFSTRQGFIELRSKSQSPCTFFFFTHDFFRYAPASYLKSTGSYALIAVVVVAVFIVPKIEFRDNSLKNYLILYARRKE